MTYGYQLTPIWICDCLTLIVTGDFPVTLIDDFQVNLIWICDYAQIQISIGDCAEFRISIGDCVEFRISIGDCVEFQILTGDCAEFRILIGDCAEYRILIGDCVEYRISIGDCEEYRILIADYQQIPNDGYVVFRICSYVLLIGDFLVIQIESVDYRRTRHFCESRHWMICGCVQVRPDHSQNLVTKINNSSVKINILLELVKIWAVANE